jgi:hypothetical protein
MKKIALTFVVTLLSTFLFSQEVKISLSSSFKKIFRKSNIKIEKTLYERGWEKTTQTIPLNLFSQLPTSSYQKWTYTKSDLVLFIFNSHNNEDHRHLNDSFIYSNIFNKDRYINSVDTRKYIFEAQKVGEDYILVFKIKT